MSIVPRRVRPEAPARRGWCPSLARPMPTGDGLLARVHPPLGQLDVAQIKAVAEAARCFGNGHVDVTARGNLQIRGVTEATAPALASYLTAAGLGDVRGDGGPQRLTLTSPLAGLDGAVDVPTLAASIETAALGVRGLPAKTLVAIEGAGLGRSEADISLHPGDAAAVQITLAGSRAGPSIVVAESDAATAVAAILRAFAASDARRVRDLGKDERAALLNGVGGGLAASQDDTAERPISFSRPYPAVLRSSLEGDLQKPPRSLESSFEATNAADQDGSTCRPDSEVPPSSLEGAFQPASAIPGSLLRGSAIAAHLRMRSREGNPAPTCRPDTQDGVPSKGRTDSPASEGERDKADPVQISAGLIPLRDGRVAVAVEAPFGRCDAGALDRLAEITAERASGHPVRTSPNRGFVLVCQTREDAEDALFRLAEAGFVTEPGDPRRAVAACPGAPACASGSTPTLDNAARLAQAFGPLVEAGLSAHVSGCAKGCARPGAADLTLVGADGRYGVVLRGPPGALPAFELTFEAALDRVRRAASTLSLDDAFRTTP